ncbi:MAG: IS1380 family transposase [Gammaproteobacteria bacterium]
MLSQTVLPFKLAATEETLTAQGGLVLFGEFCRALGLAKWLDRELPSPGSGAGYAPSVHALSLILTLHGGGRSLEDTRMLRADAGLLQVLGLAAVPSSDALGDWLRRTGAGAGMAGLNRVQRHLLRRVLAKSERRCHTLDIDATQIVAEKASARRTYTGEVGYMPIVGHLAETGLVVGEEFREGNAAPAAGNLEFIRHCEGQLPAGHRIGAVRADSAAYQAAIINDCEARGKTFAIGADRDAAVRAAIAAIPAGDWTPWRDGEIAETVHTMNATAKAFRLVVVRRARQAELFEEDGQRYRYTVVASNRDEDAPATMAFYCQRGEASENRLKELKLGFGMERLPCGQFAANAAFFRLGVLAYNLFKAFVRWTLDKRWRRCQVQTVRWRLYQSAAKVVSHAGALYLKVSTQWLALFESIRKRCWELTTEPIA